ncbi:phosphotransferase [Brasilonema sp. UFV-L1]|uniref:phosphotransferase enzyme family protein n=1 Tax=Brasilonema sp. UFV-L1 TaxID=2234130 RepID=UPI00145E2CB4|nr:phosphotransferase [Brasilonema sp. UFV-L1]NMG07848.1 hypothetical protein [Brasilonema sp. UFV-L1]
MTNDIVKAALAEYNLEQTNASLLRSLGNSTYKVVANDEKCFSLRIYSPDNFDEAQVSSELTWLRFLFSKNSILVPNPVRNKQGNFITNLHLKDSESLWLCCLFDWVEGQESSKNLSSKLIENIGETIAHLHSYSRSFHPPAGFKRKSYDANWLRKHSSWIRNAYTELSENECQLLLQAIERIYSEMVTLGESNQYFGLIHSDLHFGNFIVNSEKVQVIDFDECGWGFYLFDIAGTLMEIIDEPSQYPIFRECLLKGYEKLSPLPLTHIQQIEIFMAAQGLAFLQWVFLAKNPEVRQQKMKWVPEIIERIEEFISA